MLETSSKDYNQISFEITLLHRFSVHAKKRDFIPEYLKYQDEGYMYFPCPELPPFLKAIDLKTKEQVSFVNSELTLYRQLLISWIATLNYS